MTIFQGDITLHTSKVMLDVVEGGGGPTANIVPDGVSNAVFPDISELDRVNGRVNLRQLHVAVQSDNTDMYLGSNVIVAEPPEDPNVSITLFSTGETFDKRSDAVSRLEAYLHVGPNYAGFLFGNHITGMATLSIFQRGTVVPSVGDSLVLTKREGYNDEFVQYVRVTEASLVPTVFEDADGEFTRNVVTLKLSDTLRADFLGFDVSRYELTAAAIALRTKISSTIVADAARYYGVVPLVVDAEIGDFTVKAASVFTQLVPSAQVETPMLDLRTNQVSAVGVTVAPTPEVNSMLLPGDFNGAPSGSEVKEIRLGVAIVPGSLSVSQGSWPNSQDNSSGKLIVVPGGGTGAPVGTHVANIDYTTGLLTAVYPGDIYISSPTNPVRFQYQPYTQIEAPSQAQGFEITQSNRALNYVRTIEPPPVPGTTRVEFLAQGKWYVLQDDGTGALRGFDPSLGAGTVNFTTGTVAVTLGALPDVDSTIIFQWVQPKSEVENSALTIDNNGKFYWPVNADGVTALTTASKGIAPLGLSITWNDGAARTVTDNGSGVLTGYGTGTVNYAEGTIKLSPTTLPPKGTQITITRNTRERVTATPTVSTIGSELHFNLGASVNPGSVFFHIQGQRKFRHTGGPLGDFGDPQTYAIFDRGAGRLLMFVSAADDFAWVHDVGSINYTSGDCVLDISTTLSPAEAAIVVAFDNMYVLTTPNPVGLLASR